MMINFAESDGFGGEVNLDDDEPYVAPNSNDSRTSNVLDLSKFYPRIDELRETISECEKDLEKLSKQQTQLFKTTKADKIVELDKVIDTDTLALQAKLQKCQQTLLNIQKENNSIQSDAPELIIRRNLTDQVVGTLSQVLDRYSENQANHKIKTKETVRGRMAKDPKNFPEDRVEEILDQQPSLGDIAVGNTADRVLNHLQSRHQAALELEASMRELFGLVQEFAVLVRNQQEMLDKLETHVDSAAEHVVKGTENLEKAKKRSKKNRKCICIGLIIGIVVLIVVVALGVGIPLASS
ncbi:putative SNARE domain containing protein [Blattamonas nauphoetae]|uniref:SNARE domain containing protein n=1 Tax=Blattamonas nauphoetae TaxID=2049346 RepID=A0ABQ9WVG5_9EUKA|nr:putative SNARE domain containing protein [Blattamonas nauphoetae]